jgi:hypothetical protein
MKVGALFDLIMFNNMDLKQLKSHTVSKLKKSHMCL